MASASPSISKARPPKSRARLSAWSNPPLGIDAAVAVSALLVDIMAVGPRFTQVGGVSPRSPKAPVIGGRREPGRLAEGGGERARFAEADGQADIGYRGRRPRQHLLRALDPTAGVITMRRHAEGLLEGPAEIERAEASQLRERGERYLLGQVLLDVGDHDPLLPGRETAARARLLDPRCSGIETHQLMRQDD